MHAALSLTHTGVHAHTEKRKIGKRRTKRDHSGELEQQYLKHLGKS
jgi:hypothetical protein